MTPSPCTVTRAVVGELAHAFGSGLRNLGVQPQPKGAGEDHRGMLIYDETSAEWMIAALACERHALVTVPL